MPKKIRIDSYLLTESSLQLTHVKDLMIVDEEIPGGDGGYGTVYECLSINGQQPSSAIVIKIFKPNDHGVHLQGYKTIVSLQRNMKNCFQKKKSHAFEFLTDVPALKAFPLFSFEGTIDGLRVLGYAAYNLRELGFISFDDVTEPEGSSREYYKQVPFQKRFRFCFQLAKGFGILAEANYVHADINPKNIFIHTDTGALAVIDFDGGGIIHSEKDRTLTFGKLEDGAWLAPEIYRETEVGEEAFPDSCSDRWSVMVLFHYLIFMMDPFFFIREQSTHCKEAYLKNNAFYPVNLQDENISEVAAYSIDAYMFTVKNDVPSFIHETLVNNFEKGFALPEARDHFDQWVELFGRTQSKPEIVYFKANRQAVISQFPVTLHWEVKKTEKMFIDGIGDVSHLNQIQVWPQTHTVYTLRAYNDAGHTTGDVEINAFPVPLMKTLLVPMPEINAVIRLEKMPFSDKPVFSKLSQQVKDIKPLYQKKDTFWSISHVFNTIKASLISNT